MMAQQQLQNEQPYVFHWVIELNLMTVLQMVFYVMLMVKMIQLSYCFHRRLTIRERVVRKTKWAYMEYTKQLSEEDRMLMERTITNTIANAHTRNRYPHRNIQHSKKVNFKTQYNVYHLPAHQQHQQLMHQSEEQSERLVATTTTQPQIQAQIDDVGLAIPARENASQQVSLSGGVLMEGEGNNLFHL